jgi:hypothetical protein
MHAWLRSDLAERARQDGEKRIEAIEVTMKALRQLVENRSKPAAKLARVLE